tara:strand:- start:797 stop:1033 length:237 start_codon:yes stop_codon:yes gene_type:complete
MDKQTLDKVERFRSTFQQALQSNTLGYGSPMGAPPFGIVVYASSKKEREEYQDIMPETWEDLPVFFKVASTRAVVTGT